MSLQKWLLLSSLLVASLAYPHFRDEIPNGNNVPHTCKPNYMWQGVGHENPNGGGPRNPFGKAFQKTNYKWTFELCREDSDGDGMTNGQELGDPSCVWTPGTLPSRTIDISHPGVCDPYRNDSCMANNTFLKCDIDVFEACDAIKKPDVQQLNLTFLTTKIPPTETNYYCMTFDLPSDQDYHIIANEPIISNINILHHMLLFGCERPDDLYIPTPQPCGMNADSKCNSIIGGWTVGESGKCYGENIGFRIGSSSYQRVRLQIHYNNPALVDNYTDSSGLRLYYHTVKPGTQDLAMITTGQLLLEIPPGQKEVEHVSVCPSGCTRMLLSKPANVTSVLNHMHYRGKSMKVVVFRNGAEVKSLSHDEVYSYDSPVDHLHNPPYELLPGDEIRTTCVYSSTSTNHYVYYGESTADEMCYGFITVYPKDALRFDACVSFGSLSMCDMFSGAPIGQCNWVAFTNFTSNSKMFKDVTKNCNLDGFCRPECKVVLKTLEDNPCLQGEAFKWVVQRLKRSKDGLDFLVRLRSCPPDCNNNCTADCKNNCTADCKNECPKDCKSNCTAECKPYCTEDCKSNCTADCRSYCIAQPCAESKQGGNMARTIYTSYLHIFIFVLLIKVSGISKSSFLIK